MDGEILFLTHRVPFPPNRGDRIRSWHLLRALATLAPVHLGALVEFGERRIVPEPVAAITASSHLGVRPRSIGLAGLAALVRQQPVSVLAFASRSLRAWVAQTLATRPIATIVVFSGQMAQFVPPWFAGRVVMDFVDVDSAKFAAYADTAKSGLVRWIHAREAKGLAAWEERVAHRAALSLLITGEERDLFAARLADRPGVGRAVRLAVLGNGIDHRAFDPAAVWPEPSLAAGGPWLVFTGQMDYPPNITAVSLFARAVMPQIRWHYPDARFAIVGRAPTAEVRALGAIEGVQVTGEVADVRPWLAGAAVVVAPLTIARGVQNKVLEAMAMARAVLLTPAAATGIGGRDGEHFVLAGDVDALAARALDLIADPARRAELGAAARRFVVDHAGWDAVLAPLAAMIRPEPTDAA